MISFIQLSVVLLLAQSSIASASPQVEALLQRRGSTQYPPQYQVPDPALTPQAWTDAYNAVKDSIPNIPVSTEDSQGNINYPENHGFDPATCSWTTQKCFGPNDIYQAPSNVIGVSFDDGPTGHSSDLYSFLNQNQQSSTHFLIGTNILNYPDALKQANQEGNQQFAVHTWSHTVQTTLTNEQVLAELGWTMQIIYDLTGKIPSLWRPPQGDVDNRVRAIAEKVYGLTTVLWNRDSNDWCMNDDGTSECPGQVPGEDDKSIGDAIQGFIHNDINKPNGIIILEHELTSYSVGHFKNMYPQLKGIGWTPKSIPELDGRDWYANAVNGTSPITSQNNMILTAAITPQNVSNVAKKSQFFIHGQPSLIFSFCCFIIQSLDLNFCISFCRFKARSQQCSSGTFSSTWTTLGPNCFSFYHPFLIDFIPLGNSFLFSFRPPP